MKKNLIILVGVMGIGLSQLNAQDYKLSKSAGTLEIKEVNHVSIEGYNGTEIIFTARDHDRENDSRARGLRAVSSLGLEDNSGIGLSVLDKGNTVEVKQLKKMDGPEIKIMVPKGMSIVYDHSSPHGSEVTFKNVEGDIDVSTVHNGVSLDNVTGSVNVKTVHGDTDAIFGAGFKGPVSISSAHGHVDVSLPIATKASLKLGTEHGEIFVDPDFKMEMDHAGSMIRYSDQVTGKINGGGLEINLSSTHGNVYLRKK
jgi:hypothetical protein